MATYTEERTVQDKRQESRDLLFGNHSAPQKERVQAEPNAFSTRKIENIDQYKKGGYFAYNPYEKHTVEQSRPAERTQAPQRVQPASEMKKSLAPTEYLARETEAPAQTASAETFARERAAAYQAARANASASQAQRVSAYSEAAARPARVGTLSPARAATKKKLVKRTSAAVEESTALSTNTKVILALIASIVIMAFTVIFVNSALLNNLEAETKAVQTAYLQAVEESAELASSLEAAQSAEAAATFAEKVGMVATK